VTSPCPDHRARRRAETHRRLYLTAVQLFQERGFEAVTVGQIASAAQVSVPTFYDHFPSKEHIVLPMPEREDLQRVLLAQTEGLPLAERMRRGILTWLTSYQGQDRAELLERWQIVVRTPGLRTRAATFERATAEMILELVQSEPRPAVAAEIVVTACLSAYTQILVRWAEADGRRPLEDVAEEVLAALREL
jgi:AcrR family transcriptional regulator